MTLQTGTKPGEASERRKSLERYVEETLNELDTDARTAYEGLLRRLEPKDFELWWWFAVNSTWAVNQGKICALAECVPVLEEVVSSENYDFRCVGQPLVLYLHAASGYRGVGSNLVSEFASALLASVRLARQLGKPPAELSAYFYGSFANLFDGDPMAVLLDAQRSLEKLRELYRLDAQVAKSCAEVLAQRLVPGTDYVELVTAVLRKFGAQSKVLRGIIDPAKSAEIARMVKDYPALPFAFGNSSAAPVCDAFWPDCGWTGAEEQAAAKSEWDLMQSHHFDIETSLLLESLDDVVKRIGIKNKALSLLDLGSGDGRKLALMVKELDKKGYTLTNVGMVDCNWYSVLEAVLSIEANGRAVIAEGKGGMPVYTLLSKFNYDGRERLKLTMFQERLEELANSPGFVEFARAHPSRLTTFPGTTFCDFPPDEICDYLKGISGGFVLIGVYLYEGNDAALVQAYSDVKVRRLAENNLKLLGVSEEDIRANFEFKVEVGKAPHVCKQTVIDPLVDVRAYFVAKKAVPGRLWDIEENGLIAGIHSIKYTDRQFRQLMASHSIVVEAAYAKEDVALYLLRTPMPTLRTHQLSHGK